jgi:tyrosyl-DNA phosphodiesterase-1
MADGVIVLSDTDEDEPAPAVAQEASTSAAASSSSSSHSASQPRKPSSSYSCQYACQPGKPACQFGRTCYRENPQHWLAFDHPPDHPFITSPPSRKRARTDDGDAAAAAPQPSRTPRLGFQLDRLHSAWVGAGLVPPAANSDTFSIRDALSASALAGATQLHIHNYMIDLDLLVSECPAVATVPIVWVVHGDGHAPNSRAARAEPQRYTCLQPPCERYGTHHSKAIFIVRPLRLTIHVFTANFLFTDLFNKTNGTFTAEFPHSAGAATAPLAGFGRDLYAYLRAQKALGERPPQAWEPRNQGAAWALYDIEWVSRYDFSASPARLIGSIPGRHTGADLRKWGHLFVRAALDEEAALRPMDVMGPSDPIVLQFSSLSSPGTNVTWMAELKRSFTGGAAAPSPPIQVVFPTVHQVRDALEGWVAGSSIPCDATNAERLRERLSELSPKGELCTWDGGDGARGGAGGRGYALPHIKTFCRYRPSDRKLAWAILASHNLSQAAWGKCEKNGSQLYIKSYELGVLLLPSLLTASVDATAAAAVAAPVAGLYAAPRAGDLQPEGSVVVPLPYSLPPRPYTSTDVPWSWSDGQHAPAWVHTAGADRHHRVIGQDHGGMYHRTSWGREAVERAKAGLAAGDVR